MRRMASTPLKFRVLDLEPISGSAAPIRAAEALGYDPLKAKLAGFGEYDRGLGVDRLAELNRVEPGDECLKLGPADLELEAAPVLAVDVQKIKGDERGFGRAALRSQRREVAGAIRPENDRLAVEQGIGDASRLNAMVLAGWRGRGGGGWRGDVSQGSISLPTGGTPPLDEKTRETRMRLAADRQGFRLKKSKSRDPHTKDYGLYALVDNRIGAVNSALADRVCSWTLEQVEHYLTWP
jgi:hypothetical protein